MLQTLFDPWVIFGFAAQGVFFMRFVVQWIASEKKKKTVIPKAFWYLSLLGSAMILVYSIKRQDIVFIFATILSSVIYIRNLMLSSKKKVAA